MKRLVLAVLAVSAGFAVTGCAMRASHALMGAGLATASTAAIAGGDEGSLRPAVVSTGLAVFVVGWLLHQSDNPYPFDPSQQLYTEKSGTYRELPAARASLQLD